MATKGRVKNDTTPIFKGMGPERMAIPVVSSIFSVCFAFFGHSDV
jgi:hypothetical protein